MRDPVERFSDRVDDYVRFRPGYPPALVDVLRDAAGLRPDSVVADVGCGTGKLAERLLAAGCDVLGVEPNGLMLAAARRALGEHPGFRAVDGRAEATGLDARSVDLVAAGQAFHWFEPLATAREWRRVLRPPGRVALVWNDRAADRDGPMAAYEALVREHGTDYAEVRGGRVDERRLVEFFDGPVRRERLDNAQRLDLDGLRGRLLSCSYIPGPGRPGHAATLRAIERLFERHARGGTVELRYDCTVWIGRLEPA